MDPEILAAMSFLVLSFLLGFVSFLTHSSMAETVNANLPANERIMFGWGSGNTVSLHRAYRRQYPEGKLLRRAGILTSLSHLCVVLFAELMGFSLVLVIAYGVIGFLYIWLTYVKLARPYC